LQLRRLAALERRKIEEEYAETLKNIKYLEALLRSRRRILKLIKTELQELQAQHGDARRTRISEKEAEEISVKDLIPEEDVFIAVTQRGYVKKLSRRGNPLSRMGRDAIQYLAATNTLHNVLFCTNKGRCFTTIVHQVPDSQATGVPVSNLLTIGSDEKVTAIVDVPDFSEGGFLMMCTAQGRIKRTAVDEFSAVRSTGISAMNLDDEDELRWVKLTTGDQELILVTAGGLALRFSEDEVRAMGRSAAGVKAIRLATGDHLVGMGLVEEGNSLLVVSEKGYAKRTPLVKYPTQSRYTKGITTFATRSLTQTGRLAVACVVGDDDHIAILRASGAGLRGKASEIPQQGRATRGTALVQLKAKDTVTGIVCLPAKPRTPRPTTRAPSRGKGKAPAPRKRSSKSTTKAKTRSTRARKSRSTRTSKASATRASRSRKQAKKS
jgi:DNA gyrase subunit A